MNNDTCDVCGSIISNDDATTYAQDSFAQVHVATLICDELNVEFCCDHCFLMFTEMYDMLIELLTLKLKQIKVEGKALR